MTLEAPSVGAPTQLMPPHEAAMQFFFCMAASCGGIGCVGAPTLGASSVIHDICGHVLCLGGCLHLLRHSWCLGALILVGKKQDPIQWTALSVHIGFFLHDGLIW